MNEKDEWKIGLVAGGLAWILVILMSIWFKIDWIGVKG